MLGLGTGLNRLSAAEAAAIAGRLPGFTGLLDETFGATAEAAYSVRQLSGSQSVAMTIRRDSDNAETDIGFDSNGNLDEAAIETFCTGTVCKVSSWADQSGNGNDATQSTAAKQPTIYTGGAIVKDGGRAAFTSWSATSFNFTQITDINSVFSVLRPTDFTSSSASYILGDSTNYDYHGGDAGRWLSTAHADTVVQNGSNYLNGTSVNLTTLTRSAGQYVLSMIHTANTAVASRISKDRHLGRSWVGNRQELIIYTSDKSSDRASIESNVGDYFTQNTPLLDTYTGAAAAYSLRKLRSDYSGNAVKVRRASDNVEADIGFNVFKELNTVALAAHCGSSDGFVSVWYDQSSSNNATQTTAANQPKIYDGTTGVVTENGKPVIKFLEQGWPYLTASGFGTGNTRFVSYVAKMDAEPSVSSRYSMPWIFMQSPISTLGDYLQVNIPNITNSALLNFPTNSLDVSSASATNIQRLISFNKNAAGSEMWFDGTSQGTGSGTQNMADGLSIGRFGNYGQGIMSFQEMIIYNSDQSSNRSNIEDNINTFYSVY